MNTLLFFLMLLSISLEAKTDMEKHSESAKKFAKSHQEVLLGGIKTFDPNSIKPKDVEDFDSESARERMDGPDVQEDELLTFFRSEAVQNNLEKNSIDENEFFFDRSEKLSNQEVEDIYIETDAEYTTEKCIDCVAPYPIVHTRNLQIEVNYAPPVTEKVKVCNGHKTSKKFFFESDAESWAKHKKKELQKDTEIAKVKIRISGGSLVSDYKATVSFTHIERATRCTDYKLEPRSGQEKWEIVSEVWAYADPSALDLLKSPDCSIIDRTCIDSAQRIMHGKKVERQCWAEKVTFLQKAAGSKQCAHLRDRNCTEASRKCIRDGIGGCSVWEISYKCFTKVKKRSLENGGEIFSPDVEEEYQPNQSFSAIATKLKIFEQIKSEMEAQDEKDPLKVELFGGKNLECSKSVAGDLMYDCCFHFDGLAKEVKLSQCNEEENALRAMREKELCVYVGKYEEDFMGLWKSKDVHVYCCFPTKLARIFQEEAKEQLGLDWGSPKKPNCKGLRHEEITKLDFSKLDLSEAFDVDVKDIEKRLENKIKDHQIDPERIEKRIKEKLQSTEGEG